MDLVVKHKDLSLLNSNQCLVCHGNLSLVRSAPPCVEETTETLSLCSVKKEKHTKRSGFFFF